MPTKTAKAQALHTLYRAVKKANTGALTELLRHKYHTKLAKPTKPPKAKPIKPAEEPESKPQSANDIVDMESTSGLLADYLPAVWGGERAGRSDAMARAAGIDSGFNVRHPMTAATLAGVAGALPGTVLGGLGGGGLAYALHGNDPKSIINSAGLGGVLGAVGGLGLSQVIATALRRNKMKEINKAYDESLADGKLNVRHPRFSALAALLAPYRGPHRTGQLEATRAMRDNLPIAKQRNYERDIFYTLRGIPYSLMPLAHGYAQNLRTQFAKNPEKGR